MHTRMHAHTRTHTLAHTHMHTHMHAHTRTHTHTHIHTYSTPSPPHTHTHTALFQTFLEEIRAPKIVRQHEGQSCQVHNPSLFLPQMVHTASSKACLTLSDAFHKKPPGRREGGRRGERREILEAQVTMGIELWTEVLSAARLQEWKCFSHMHLVTEVTSRD